MKLSSDSTYTLTLIDASSPVKISKWSMTHDKIRLDTNTYAINQWTVQGEKLQIRGAYPIQFRRLTDVTIDSALVRQTITNFQWQSDSLTYHFHQDGTACLDNRKTNVIAIRCWRLAQIDHSVFLVIKGNADSCSGNFDYPMQITKLNSKEIECLGGDGGIDRLVFRRGNQLQIGHQCQPKGFQPCNISTLPYFNLYPYYTYRIGRLYDIRQIIDREFKSVALAGQSGLIRFKFIVNCHGEAGQFDVLEVDENYQKRSFDSRITSQLLSICRTKLTNWEPGKRNEDQMPVDTYCLLTFRLKDGLITDIFP